MQDFIINCLKLKEVNRISWEQIYTHPIFNSYFKNFVKENELLEHKLKKLMNDLRFIVNSQNIDIKNLMTMVGIKEN